MRCSAERKNAFLRAALFFVAAGATKGCVKAVKVQRLFQPFGLPHVGVQRAMVERIDAAFLGFRVLVHQQLHPAFFGHPVAQGIHVLEFPGRIDVQQREGRRRGVECLAGEVQHDRTILANGVKHHRLFRLGHHLTHNVDALSLKSFEMRQISGHGEAIFLYFVVRSLHGISKRSRKNRLSIC